MEIQIIWKMERSILRRCRFFVALISKRKNNRIEAKQTKKQSKAKQRREEEKKRRREEKRRENNPPTNLHKQRWKLFRVVREIEKFQKSQYIFQEIPSIRTFLENLNNLEEDERYQRAKKIADLQKETLHLRKNSSFKLPQSLAGLFKGD